MTAFGVFNLRESVNQWIVFDSSLTPQKALSKNHRIAKRLNEQVCVRGSDRIDVDAPAAGVETCHHKVFRRKPVHKSLKDKLAYLFMKVVLSSKRHNITKEILTSGRTTFAHAYNYSSPIRLVRHSAI